MSQDTERQESKKEVVSIDSILKGKIAGPESMFSLRTPEKIKGLLPRIRNGKKVKSILVSHKCISKDGQVINQFNDSSFVTHASSDQFEMDFSQLYYLNSPSLLTMLK